MHPRKVVQVPAATHSIAIPNRAGHGFLRVAAALVLALCAVAIAGSARAEYRLTSGDVVNINVFRVPDLERDATLDIDGRVAFPPLGLVDAEGLTSAELGTAIRDLLAEQQVLSDAQVTVALVAASPIFVGGDVASPGLYEFRHGLTVRRAVALAGGMGISRARAPEEIERLRGERAAEAVATLGARVRVARLMSEIAGEAELRDTGALDRGGALGNLPSPARRDEIVTLGARQLEANLAEADAEKSHLDRRVELARERIETLEEQRDIQNDLLTRQREEIERIGTMQERGLTNQSRVLDERRALDLMQERVTDTLAEMTAARGSLADATFERDRFESRRRTALDAELQDALLAMEAGESRLNAITARLAQLGFSDGIQTEFTLYRAGEGTETGVAAEPQTLLEPGDMIEITIELSTSIPALPEQISQTN